MFMDLTLSRLCCDENHREKQEMNLTGSRKKTTTVSLLFLPLALAVAAA